MIFQASIFRCVSCSREGTHPGNSFLRITAPPGDWWSKGPRRQWRFHKQGLDFLTRHWKGLPPKKLTCQQKPTIGRCISYWNWGYSNVMLVFRGVLLLSSWWLNHPSEKICSSNGIMKPQFSGWTNLWNHHLVLMVHKSWRSPVEVGSLFSLSNVLHIPGGWEWDFINRRYVSTDHGIHRIHWTGCTYNSHQVSSSCLGLRWFDPIGRRWM